MYAVDGAGHVLPVVDVCCLRIENLTGRDKYMYLYLMRLNAALLPNMGKRFRGKLYHVSDSIKQKKCR